MMTARKRIKVLISRNPGITVDELEAILKEEGRNVSRLAISSIRSGFQESLRVLHAEGLIKLDLDAFHRHKLSHDGFFPSRSKPKSPPVKKEKNAFGEYRKKKKPFRPWNFSG